MLDLSRLGARRKITCFMPDTAPCPRCGSRAARNEKRRRNYWEPSLNQASVVEAEYGCYLCPTCPKGQTWFTLVPEEFQTHRQYTVSAQQALVDLVQKHRMSVEAATAVGQDILHLPELEATTVLAWLRVAGEAVDAEAHKKAAVEGFSGEMAVDEVYDGGWYVIKATDPLNGVELSWELGRGSPSKEDVRGFFLYLKATGFYPKLVVTDGANLYPEVIAEVWPESRHQRCVFHFIKQINEDLREVFDAAYNRLPKPLKRKAGRPKKRGRPRKDKEKREVRRKVRRVRYIVLKAERRLSDKERAMLVEAIELCPRLGVLRLFVLSVHQLFAPETTDHAQSKQRRQNILLCSEFNDLPGLEKSLKRLRDDDLFTRLTRYLDFENADKTSNHPERENRIFRKRQKIHYRLRSLRTLIALLNLLTVRNPMPEQSTRLRRKPPDHVVAREVCRAA